MCNQVDRITESVEIRFLIKARSQIFCHRCTSLIVNYKAMDKAAPTPGSNPNPAQPQPAPFHIQPQATFNYIRAPIFGPGPTLAHCPTCKEDVQSNVDKKASGKTHLVALGLCVCCCWLCIPCVYCCDGLRETNHSCPTCNTYLGKYSSI